MKKNVIGLIISVVTLTMNLNAQVLINSLKIETVSSGEKPLVSDPIQHVSDKLFPKELAEKLKATDQKSNNKSIKKITADNVGDIKNFWVSNSEVPEEPVNFESRAFKLMRKGTVAQLWFATAEIGDGMLTESVADSMFAYLENKTNINSFNPQKGVIALGNQVFGAPPNFDGDGLSDVLVCDIRDGWTPGNAYTAGFFYGIDQYTQTAIDNDGSLAGYKSNQRDIIYIDAYPGIYYNGNVNPKAPLSVLSHEYQHLIHFKYDKNEITFINEAQSCFASLLVGYIPHESVSDYLSNTNISIFGWRSGNAVLGDYGRAAMFSSYLWDRFGFENAGLLTRNASVGTAGINSVLTTMNTGLNFESLLTNWAVANIVGDTTIHRLYGYKTPFLKSLKATKSIEGNATVSKAVNVQPGGVYYMTFKNISDLQMTVTFGSAGNVKVITKKDGVQTVSDITSAIKWTSSAGINYDEITFILVNKNSAAVLPFTINSTGTQTSVTSTLTYYGASTYYFAFPSGNGVRVGYGTRFTPPSGNGKVKNVSYFIYNATAGTGVVGTPTMQIGFYKLTGGIPEKNAIDSVLITSGNIALASFTDVDVSSRNWATNGSDFVVGVKIILSAGTDKLHFLSDDGTNSLDRSYIVQNDGVWKTTPDYYADPEAANYNFLIKASVEVSTGVEYSYEGKSDKNKTFTLSQNYPNPFNPTTLIEFSTPINSEGNTTSLIVYNSLGQKVTTLLNNSISSGSHKIFWDGKDSNGNVLSSGVYLYVLQSGNFRQTKQMILVK